LEACVSKYLQRPRLTGSVTNEHLLLWAAVLWQQVADVCLQSALNGGETKEGHAEAAERWFGSRDFRLVCDYAGLDPDAVLDRVGPVLALPRAERRVWWAQMGARLADWERARVEARKAEVSHFGDERPSRLRVKAERLEGRAGV
jgi:hypothetical protein